MVLSQGQFHPLEDIGNVWRHVWLSKLPEEVIVHRVWPQMSAVLRLGNPVLQFEKSEDNFTQTKNQTATAENPPGILRAVAHFFNSETRDNLIYADGHT